MYEMYYSRAGRDLWRTSDVVPRSEAGVAEPNPFLTGFQPGCCSVVCGKLRRSNLPDSKLKFASTRVPLMVRFRAHTAKSIYIFPVFEQPGKNLLF